MDTQYSVNNSSWWENEIRFHFWSNIRILINSCMLIQYFNATGAHFFCYLIWRKIVDIRFFIKCRTFFALNKHDPVQILPGIALDLEPLKKSMAGSAPLVLIRGRKLDRFLIALYKEKKSIKTIYPSNGCMLDNKDWPALCCL